jgi:hypothetical protein
VAIVGAVLFAPWLREPLRTVRPNLAEFSLVAGLAFLPAMGVEALKVAVRRGWLPGAEP